LDSMTWRISSALVVAFAEPEPPRELPPRLRVELPGELREESGLVLLEARDCPWDAEPEPEPERELDLEPEERERFADDEADLMRVAMDGSPRAWLVEPGSS
jgi:hypothetical protein